MVSITAVTTICQSPGYGGTAIRHQGVKIFKARLFQPANIRRVGKFPPEGLFFLFPFLVKRGCAGVRTNNKTGVGHFAFLYLSEN
jgi:hypothetical protein